jgi:integrase
MAKRRKTPGYLHHKPRDLAYVRLPGQKKPIYLGPYGSPESRSRYEEIIADWQRNQNVDRHTLTLDELALRYIEHAKKHYRKNGQETSEVVSVRGCLRVLVAVAGKMRATDFGPLKLREVRDSMIAQGWKRKSINKQVSRICRIFDWAETLEMTPAGIANPLRKLPGLRQGRSDAVESVPVQPVSDAAIESIRPHVSRHVWAMIQLQRLSGMRPGEVTAMRGCDLNMSGELWEYVPESHKTEHHGRERLIVLGKKAQTIIREFLKPNLNAYLFAPSDVREEFDAKRRSNRKTPLTPSQKARKRKQNPERKPGEHYTTASYGQAIRKACEKALDMPKELRNVSTRLPVKEREQLKQQAREWREQHCWHPHQLRHTAATEIRRKFGIEASQVVLGHASLSVTEVYAERDNRLAHEVMKQLG